MPNYCDYAMRVVGQKDNVEEFIKVIQSDYNYRENKFDFDRHLFRVFEATVQDDYMQGITRVVDIVGYCAWSVYSCMLEGPFTYYNDRLNEAINYGTSLLQESKRLGLIIEVYSCELGMAFQEHYLIHNNEYIINKEVPYSEYYLGEYESYEEWLKEEGSTDVTEEEYLQAKANNTDYIEHGGFGDWPYKYSNFDIMARTVKKYIG